MREDLTHAGLSRALGGCWSAVLCPQHSQRPQEAASQQALGSYERDSSQWQVGPCLSVTSEPTELPTGPEGREIRPAWPAQQVCWRNQDCSMQFGGHTGDAGDPCDLGEGSVLLWANFRWPSTGEAEAAQLFTGIKTEPFGTFHFLLEGSGLYQASVDMCS